jgi:cell division protein FtsI (penicillin-binding protein 3)
MGEILDRNGVPLVTSVTYYDIHMDPTVVDQKVFDDELSDLGEELHKIYPDKSANEYIDLIRKGRFNKSRYVHIRSRVTNEERKRLSKLPIFREGRLKGGLIDTDEIIIRELPNGELLKRTLGYSRDKKGLKTLVGIEGSFYQYLRGEDGAEIEQRISTGWKKTGQITKEAIEGASLITTIDKEIQEVAHSELERQLREMNAKHGCVVVMEVKTGFIRAIVNLTNNDNKSFSESYNYAIGYNEVPGSTFKLASIMAGLEDGMFKITDKVNASGSYSFPGKRLQDSNHGVGYGTITIQKAFEKSSNVIAQIIYSAYKNQPEKFLARLKQFGLTEPLNIAINGEATPVIPKMGTPGWSPLSIPMMAIGYELQQTPLQTLTFYNAVANEGKMVRPLFVEKIVRSGQVLKTFTPEVIREEICSNSTLKILQLCLKGVMTDGTGSDLKSSLFTIAGKTGTAKLIGENKLYNDQINSAYQASFVGYFPADKPIYSCIVVISDPKKEIYGAKVSGTVFAEIANKIYASTLSYHKAINQNTMKKKDLPILKNGNHRDIISVLKELNIQFELKNSGEWLTADTLNGSVNLVKIPIPGNKIPNVLGLTAKDAIYLLESKGLIVELVGFGRVIKQSLTPDMNVTRGQLIKIELQ